MQAKMDNGHVLSVLWNRHKLTVFAAVFGIFYLLVALTYGLDLFEYLIESFHELQKMVEPYEGDEVIPVLILVGGAIFGDLVRQRRQARRDQEMFNHRLDVMRTTMGSVQDVVNNFLNNMQLFRLEAERTGALDGDQLQQFDGLIGETAQKLKAIEDESDASEGADAYRALFKDYT